MPTVNSIPGSSNWLKICKYIPFVSSVMMVPALILLALKYYQIKDLALKYHQVKDLTGCVKDSKRLQAEKIRVLVTWFFAILPVIGNLAAFVWDRSAQNQK